MRSQMNSMYKTARQILQSDEDIADAVQETILTCWQKLDQLRDDHAWRAWMMRILINNCYEQIRKHGSETSMEVLPEAATYSENYGQVEWQDLLWRLDEKYRMVLILYYLEGFRTGEIAQILGMPETTVRTRLKRGRERLAEEYHGGKPNE
ncbi:MAG: RNA polymerase sigma factor [Blautia sp.]|nr:RNA polymerase sigma factor [Blautia sp.]